MEYNIGSTKGGKVIIQDMSNGNIKIKENKSDDISIIYSYADWLKIKNEVADYGTILYEYNPKFPNKLVPYFADEYLNKNRKHNTEKKSAGDSSGDSSDEKEPENQDQKATLRSEVGGFIDIVFIFVVIVFLVGVVMKTFFPKKESE